VPPPTTVRVLFMLPFFGRTLVAPPYTACPLRRSERRRQRRGHLLRLRAAAAFPSDTPRQVSKPLGRRRPLLLPRKQAAEAAGPARRGLVAGARVEAAQLRSDQRDGRARWTNSAAWPSVRPGPLVPSSSAALGGACRRSDPGLPPSAPPAAAPPKLPPWPQSQQTSWEAHWRAHLIRQSMAWRPPAVLALHAADASERTPLSDVDPPDRRGGCATWPAMEWARQPEDCAGPAAAGWPLSIRPRGRPAGCTGWAIARGRKAAARPTRSPATRRTIGGQLDEPLRARRGKTHNPQERFRACDGPPLAEVGAAVEAARAERSAARFPRHPRQVSCAPSLRSLAGRRKAEHAGVAASRSFTMSP